MISIDFVVELPESAEFNIMITIADFIFKTAYFILAHTMKKQPNSFYTTCESFMVSLYKLSLIVDLSL